MRLILFILFTLFLFQCNTNDPFNDPTGEKTKKVKKKKSCNRDALVVYLIFNNDYRFSCNNPDYVKGINAKSLEECLSKRNESIIFNLGTVYSVCSSDEEGANG
ncbi:MAG TPA: hypothetical protein PK079_10825 [Leptospiraceae bacterium]|nr:hypothetical protein [Leptospiraceae bacterium]HMW05873.1 hypothetical protein [Leptospiraceae bacterium]HMY32762.1 hypothetical protein [Leptospiraceae bacterium]HMZ67207.1 hypothetical protein [Leptospiraceae bacterium]HNA05802.1 hypothetical protein [Leptospiraceae bacterium]